MSPDVLTILLGITLALLVLLAGVALSIREILLRLEARLSKLAVSKEPTSSGGKEATSDQESAFDVFIAEDPARMTLPKAEQFAEYRKWRREKGMNWSNS